MLSSNFSGIISYKVIAVSFKSCLFSKEELSLDFITLYKEESIFFKVSIILFIKSKKKLKPFSEFKYSLIYSYKLWLKF